MEQLDILVEDGGCVHIRNQSKGSDLGEVDPAVAVRCRRLHIQVLRTVPLSRDILVSASFIPSGPLDEVTLLTV